MSRLALLDNDKCFCWHDASVMSHWHDDDRIITIQPMVICFSWEKQVSVAPKDVPTDRLLSSSPTTTPLRWWSINLLQFIFYHSRSTDFEEKIEGLWSAQQTNILNNYALKRYVWFSLHHFALWLYHSIFCISLRNCSPLSWSFRTWRKNNQCTVFRV